MIWPLIKSKTKNSSRKHHLYVHIGAPKTATSFLQKNLEVNQSLITKSGMNLILPKSIRDTELMNNAMKFYRGKLSKIDSAIFESFLSENIDQTLPMTLISEETFGHDLMPSSHGFGGIDRIKETTQIAKAFNIDDTKIILNVRRQDHYLISVYTHFVHRHGLSASFEDWIENKVNLRNLSWLKVVVHLIENFGENNVYILPFELINEGPEVYYKSFGEVFDLNFFNHQINIDMVNRSLSDLGVRLSTQANGIIADKRKKIQLIDMLIENLPKNIYGQFNPITAEIFQTLSKLYKRENEIILKNYCIRPHSNFGFGN